MSDSLGDGVVGKRCKNEWHRLFSFVFVLLSLGLVQLGGSTTTTKSIEIGSDLGEHVVVRGGPRPHARLLVNSKFQGNVVGFSPLVAALESARAADPNTVTVAHGDTIGASTYVSKILEEKPSSLMATLLGVQVDTFANNNFNSGLKNLAELLPAMSSTKFVVANVPNNTLLSPLVRRWAVVTVPSGAKIAFVGVMSASDTAVIDQTILRDVPFEDDISSLIAARNEVVAQEAPDYVVALVSRHTQTRAIGLAYVEPWAPLFDCICLGINRDDAFIVRVNGTLVVSGREQGATFVQVDLGLSSAVSVTVNQARKTPYSALHAEMWSNHATFAGSAVRVTIDRQIRARSLTLGTNGLRHVRVSENALTHLWLQGMMDVTNASIGLVNTGAFRDDLPSSFVPSAEVVVKRPAPNVTGVYNTVSGDCPIIMPFGNTIQYVDVSSAELCAYARWAMVGETGSVGAVGLLGQIRGIQVGVTFFPDLTSQMRYIRWPDGRDVDCLLATDRHRMALSSFLASGGDACPIPSGPVTALTVSDVQVMCEAIATVKGRLQLEAFSPGTTLVTRVEQSCGRKALVMEQSHVFLWISASSFEGFGVSADPSDCASVSMAVLKAEAVVNPVRATLSSVATTFQAPNAFSVLFRETNPVVLAGQIWGNALNITVNAPNGTSSVVGLCIAARPESLPRAGAFSLDAFAVSEDGGRFWVRDSLIVNRTYDDTGTLQFCTNMTLFSGVTYVIAPAQVAPSGASYSAVEQAFLFLFGIAWLAFAIYAGVLLVHSIYLTLQNEKVDLEVFDFLLPANWVRLELVLIGLCRFLYFVLLPWQVLQNDPVGAAFLFEFPFLLDISI